MGNTPQTQYLGFKHESDPLKPQLITADQRADLHLAVLESPARRVLVAIKMSWGNEGTSAKNPG
jgi:hypothetical protein